MPRQHNDRYSPIAGSHLVRDYCAECDEPIRISGERMGKENHCQDCQPGQRFHGGVGNGRRVYDDDANGGLSNAVRAMED